MSSIQIPFVPKRGEIWFYITLNQVPSHQIPGLFTLVESLGFHPQWAFRALPEEVEVCILLYQGFSDDMVKPPSRLYEQEQQALANALEEPNAMHFLCGLHRKPAIAA